jgi:uroporphyrinogen-III synthase
VQKLIITRPQPDADLFAATAHAAGYAPIVSPVIEIYQDNYQAHFRDAKTLVFTSANGVRYCPFATFAGPVYAVGNSTAEACRQKGFADVRESASDGKSLASLIVDERPAEPIIHFSGRDQAFDVAGALRAAALDASRIVVYRAEAAASLAEAARRAICEDAREAWVSFFSARSVEIFCDLLQKEGLATQVSALSAAFLSDAIATSSDEKWLRTAIAAVPSASSLLAAISRET